ncbi:MAG: threonine synthase [Lachnospiraceae bacterium]|nr:threonine synthase [Lachnospiraceae bacterium]
MSSTNSFAANLVCPKCKKEYALHEVHQLCACGSPLLVSYDLKEAKKHFHKESLRDRESSLWRYKELLPVQDEANIVSLGEGFTPIIPLKRAGEKSKIQNLYLKDEGIIPTGTFKARGAAVGVSRAKELGVKVLAMPTNGNAGAAWSVYSARAGLKATIIMPEDAPSITRNECAAAGADLYLVKGLISDCGKIVARSVQEHGWYDASTLKEPYRIEGKKTMGLEIAEQFDWKLPDVILYPTGGGVGIIGIYKALNELKELGFIEGKLPRLVAVQAEGCAPIVKAFQEGKKESEFFADSKTVAFGINVPKALGDFLVLEALYQTGGCAKAVSDAEILEGLKELSQTEGTFVCPEGAAIYAAAKKLREENWIKEGERVVLLNTGAGIKYPDTLSIEVPYLDKDAVL